MDNGAAAVYLQEDFTGRASSPNVESRRSDPDGKRLWSTAAVAHFRPALGGACFRSALVGGHIWAEQAGAHARSEFWAGLAGVRPMSELWAELPGVRSRSACRSARSAGRHSGRLWAVRAAGRRWAVARTKRSNTAVCLAAQQWVMCVSQRNSQASVENLADFFGIHNDIPPHTTIGEWRPRDLPRGCIGLQMRAIFPRLKSEAIYSAISIYVII